MSLTSVDKSGLFMPLMIVAATVVVPVIAVTQSKLFDAAAAEAQAKEEHARAFERTLDGVGFAPLATVGPDRTAMWTAAHTISWKLANGEITADAPEEADVARVRATLERELSRYPRGWVTRANMSRVLVVANLREKGLEIPSLPNIDGAWLLDATASDEFAARLTHHELYHFVDLAEDGTLDRDDAWAALNDKSFSYGAGGRSLRARWASEPSEMAPGFVSAYAASALAEDKAETFAFWMTKPDEALALARRDVVVAKKLSTLRSRLAD
jgi:hypothetical protein